MQLTDVPGFYPGYICFRVYVIELLPVWWTSCLACNSDPRELQSAKIADGRMLSLRVIEHLNVVKRVGRREIAGLADFAGCALGF